MCQLFLAPPFKHLCNPFSCPPVPVARPQIPFQSGCSRCAQVASGLLNLLLHNSNHVWLRYASVICYHPFSCPPGQVETRQQLQTKCRSQRQDTVSPKQTSGETRPQRQAKCQCLEANKCRRQGRCLSDRTQEMPSAPSPMEQSQLSSHQAQVDRSHELIRETNQRAHGSPVLSLIKVAMKTDEIEK